MTTDTAPFRLSPEIVEDINQKRNIEHQQLSNVFDLVEQHQEAMGPISDAANRMEAIIKLMANSRRGIVSETLVQLPDTTIFGTHPAPSHLRSIKIPFYPITEPNEENGLVLAASIADTYRDALHAPSQELVPTQTLFTAWVAKTGLNKVTAYQISPIMRLEHYSRRQLKTTQRVPDTEFEVRYESDNRQVRSYSNPNLGIRPVDWVDLAKQLPPKGTSEVFQYIDEKFIMPLFESVKSSYDCTEKVKDPVWGTTSYGDGYQPMQEALTVIRRGLPIGKMVINLPPENQE